ncbi:MAG: hypothetical protein V2A73_16300, partial [Pseudomonadota bacterium]
MTICALACSCKAKDEKGASIPDAQKGGTAPSSTAEASSSKDEIEKLLAELEKKLPEDAEGVNRASARVKEAMEKHRSFFATEAGGRLQLDLLELHNALKNRGLWLDCASKTSVTEADECVAGRIDPQKSTTLTVWKIQRDSCIKMLQQLPLENVRRSGSLGNACSAVAPFPDAEMRLVFSGNRPLSEAEGGD